MSKTVYLGMTADIMHPGLINIIKEATKYGKVGPAEVDPTGNFYRAITRYISRISALKKALEKEKSNLNTYLENQEKALSIVRNFREGNTN